MKRLTHFAIVAFLLTPAAHAQEVEDQSEAFTPVKGGVVYDWKVGVDGSLISEQFMLTHVTCTKGSDKLRVMLPLGPDDNDIGFTMDGETSTLKKSGDHWKADFTFNGKRATKDVMLKPVNDPKSQNSEQFEITLQYGDPLWKAMSDPEPGKAMMMIGTGGTPVEMPGSKTFDAFLRACGLKTG